MLETKITPEELEFMEIWHTPVALGECMFSNLDNLSLFSEDKFLDIWLGQYPLLSYEYMIDTQVEGLNEKEKFSLREGAGNLYCFAARNWGKSVIGEKIDLLLYILCEENESCGFSSFDFQHIQGMLESVLKALEFHPIVKTFIENIKRNPYYIYTKNGLLVESVNMGISDGKKSGSAFQQKHFKKLYIEEASRETQLVYENRLEAKSNIGCVFRILGMTNFTRNSPPGKMFFDTENKAQVLNVPAYINPNYGAKEEKQSIKKYGGKQSIAFRLFVDGDIIQEGVSALDMNRVRENCYPHDKNGFIDYANTIKSFEINQETFHNYKHTLVVERNPNIKLLYIAADIGDIGGTTEIIVMGLVNNIWRYIYNITLRNIDNKQSYKVFKHLYKKLNPDKMGNDNSEGIGKAIYRDLKDDPEIDSKKLVWCSFNENIEVGYEKDDKDKPIRVNGKLVVQYEHTLVWAVQRLCHLLYEPLVFLPMDYKLDTQLESVVAVPRGNSVTYECLSEENHLWQAFEVFSIMQWKNEFEGFSKTESIETFKKKHINCGA
jgi:hypothetical protein